jgi:hypothetical protein
MQKCRENKYIVRDFVYSEEEIERQREELLDADATEKELWVSLDVATLTCSQTCVSTDGTSTPLSGQLLRVIPNFRAFQSDSFVCRERPPVWSSCPLYGLHYKGET